MPSVEVDAKIQTPASATSSGTSTRKSAVRAGRLELRDLNSLVALVRMFLVMNPIA